MTPNYSDHAPSGWMGDPKRGAAMGRPNRGDMRSPAEIEKAFCQVAVFLDRALRLKENRPSDGFKAECWEAAAAHWREERDTLKAAHKAAVAREASSPKMTLQRIRLDSGGYDSAGTYWGHHKRLYWAATDDGESEMTLRATDRDDAKRQVRETFPNARFHN